MHIFNILPVHKTSILQHAPALHITHCSICQVHIRSRFFSKNIALKKFIFNFALPKGLTDGVTVALQFLELSVQVRILVGQPKKKALKISAFFVSL